MEVTSFMRPSLRDLLCKGQGLSGVQVTPPRPGTTVRGCPYVPWSCYPDDIIQFAPSSERPEVPMMAAKTNGFHSEFLSL